MLDLTWWQAFALIGSASPEEVKANVQALETKLKSEEGKKQAPTPVRCSISAT